MADESKGDSGLSVEQAFKRIGNSCTIRVDEGSAGEVKVMYSMLAVPESNTVKTSHPTSEMAILKSQSAETLDTELQASLGIAGKYGKFLGAVQAKYSQARMASLQCAYHEVRNMFKVYEIRIDSLKPAELISAEALEFVKEHKDDGEHLVKNLGEMWVKRVALGGSFVKTVAVQMTEEESKMSGGVKMEGALKKLMKEVKVNADVAYGTRSGHQGAKASCSIKVQGGDTSVWGGLNESNELDTQKDWQNSIEEHNLFPVQYELGAIHELFKEHPDPDVIAAAASIEEYLEEQYGDADKAFKSWITGLTYAPSLPSALLPAEGLYALESQRHDVGKKKHMSQRPNDEDKGRTLARRLIKKLEKFTLIHHPTNANQCYLRGAWGFVSAFDDGWVRHTPNQDKWELLTLDAVLGKAGVYYIRTWKGNLSMRKGKEAFKAEDLPRRPKPWYVVCKDEQTNFEEWKFVSVKA